jgi:thioredoxin
MAQIGDDSNFDQIVGQGTTPVLIDFWAPWCKPCHALGPILQEVEAASNSRFQLLKVNADECTAVAQRFNVRSLPTLVLLSDGEILSRKIGSLSRSALEQWLNESLPSA